MPFDKGEPDLMRVTGLSRGVSIFYILPEIGLES